METIQKRLSEKSTWLGIFSMILVGARVKYPEYAGVIDYALVTIGATGIVTPDTQHHVQNFQ